MALLAVMIVLTLVLASCLANSPAVVGPRFHVDGVWGIPDQGTDGQGANCDRWATGPGGSPSAISDTDPGIQNQATDDENQIRYGAQDVNDDPCMFPDAPNDPPCGEKVTVASEPLQTTVLAIEGKKYTLELVGFTDCDLPGTPTNFFYTHEMAADKACLYARLVELGTGL
jgi:hypothetical protein